jgi:glycerophosphoryl diester phosphodiesterase
MIVDNFAKLCVNMRWILLLLFFSCAVSKPTAMQFASNPVVAHRGAFKAMQYPENSIAAMRHAIEMKCTGSEFDVWMTADDSLVLNHDPVYHGLEIERSVYAALTKHPLTNGEPLPGLRNFLVAGMANNASTRLILEIKPSRIDKSRGVEVAKKVVQMVDELKAKKYITYISFDHDILKAVLKEDPAAITQYLNGDLPPEQLKKDGIAGLDYHFSVFKKHPEWITTAKQLNLQLNAWTVNEASDMNWLLDSSFHFITTNEPELLLQLVKQRSGR